MRITGDPYMSSYSTIRTRSSRVSIFSFCSIHSTDAARKVAIGDRIAQLILEKIETPPVLEVDVSGDIYSGPYVYLHLCRILKRL